MNGTIFSHTLEMDLMPPMMTTATRIIMMMPTAQIGICGKYSVTMPHTELDWTAPPMPNEASAANNANRTATTFAQVAPLKPRSRAYIAPPSMSPLWSLTRYLTEMSVSAYLVAMPRIPMIHIQNTAPTPPLTMAVATPTMLPVPMVAESAVVNAPNWLMLPCASLSFAKESLMPVKTLR